MHKTKIDWADATWNPITGCKHECPYCYAKQMTKRFSGDVRMNLTAGGRFHRHEGKEDLLVLEKPFPTRQNRSLAYPFGFLPTYHRYRLNDLAKWKNGVNIFVCSMADLFGEWVPEDWILEIFQKCREHPQHNYLFLTKNPRRYEDLKNKGFLPRGSNFWYGTTVTKVDDEYFHHGGYQSFLSLEPLEADIGDFLSQGSAYLSVYWLIVGAETGKRKGKVAPQKEWIENIQKVAKYSGVPVFMKDSIRDLMGEEFRQELPTGLVENRPSPKLSANCLECKANFRKADMTAILSRSGRQRSTKTLGYVCQDCLKEMLERWT